jgi:hypothetical protein
VTEAARIVAMTQMVAELITVGVVARLLVGAVKRADERISAEIGHGEANPGIDLRRTGEHLGKGGQL